MKEQLPAFVLAQLFENALVCTDDGPADELNIDNAHQPQKPYLGNYEKKIIVLVKDAENSYLGDENLQFLSGILKACKLNIADIALINFNSKPVNFTNLKKEMNPVFLLSFGIPALQIELPFNMPDYQVQQYDSCRITTAPSLTELNNETSKAITEKKKLWKSLQNMFDIE